MSIERIMNNLAKSYTKRNSKILLATKRSQQRAARNIRVFIRREIQKTTTYKAGVLKNRILFMGGTRAKKKPTIKTKKKGSGFSLENGLKVSGQPLNVSAMKGTRMNAQRAGPRSKGDRRRSRGIVVKGPIKPGQDLSQGFIAHRGPGKTVGVNAAGKKGYFAVRTGHGRGAIKGLEGLSPGDEARKANKTIARAYKKMFRKEFAIQKRKLRF